MWLFTPLGFYSVVKNAMPRKKGVLIRSRNRDHIDALCKLIGVKLARVLVTPANDYRFRIEATPKEFNKVMALLAEMPADYTNFKGVCSGRAAAGKLDAEYVVALSDIWHTMFEYQHDNPKHKEK